MTDRINSTPDRSFRDHVDMACTMLADENALLREQLADADVYRDLTKASIEALAAMTEERNRLRQRLHHLVEELRLRAGRQAA